MCDQKILYWLSSIYTYNAFMSFTHLDYDPCTYQTNLVQSIGPGDYSIATPFVQCSTCLSGDPWLQGSGGVSVCEDRLLIDIDSELHNLTRPATNCPAGMYHPTKTPFCTSSKDFGACLDAVATEDTRLTNPPCTLRGTGWNRWEWLCRNPQENIEVPFDWNISSKLVAKDNHRPCIPCPLNDSRALPIDDGNEVKWTPTACAGGDQTRTMPRVDWRTCASLHQL